MSDRKCNKCKKGEYVAPSDSMKCPYFGPHRIARELWYLTASICRCYSERAELCGAEVEAKCGNKLQADDIAEDTFCDKPAGHKGKHCNSRDTNYGKRLIIWFDPTIWNDPTPTAFNKAWREHARNNLLGLAGSTFEGYKSGWQAMWDIMSEWARSCPGPDPIDVNAFRMAMHKYKVPE